MKYVKGRIKATYSAFHGCVCAVSRLPFGTESHQVRTLVDSGFPRPSQPPYVPKGYRSSESVAAPFVPYDCWHPTPLQSGKPQVLLRGRAEIDCMSVYHI